MRSVPRLIGCVHEVARQAHDHREHATGIVPKVEHEAARVARVEQHAIDVGGERDHPDVECEDPHAAATRRGGPAVVHSRDERRQVPEGDRLAGLGGTCDLEFPRTFGVVTQPQAHGRAGRAAQQCMRSRPHSKVARHGRCSSRLPPAFALRPHRRRRGSSRPSSPAAAAGPPRSTRQTTASPPMGVTSSPADPSAGPDCADEPIVDGRRHQLEVRAADARQQSVEHVAQLVRDSSRPRHAGGTRPAVASQSASVIASSTYVSADGAPGLVERGRRVGDVADARRNRRGDLRSRRNGRARQEQPEQCQERSASGRRIWKKCALNRAGSAPSTVAHRGAVCPGFAMSGRDRLTAAVAHRRGAGRARGAAGRSCCTRRRHRCASCRSSP